MARGLINQIEIQTGKTIGRRSRGPLRSRGKHASQVRVVKTYSIYAQDSQDSPEDRI